MSITKRLFILIGIVSSIMVLLGVASENKDERTQIQHSMKKYIENRTVDGVYYYYDPVEKRTLKLKFDYLHDGVKQNGDFFVSCADFKDQYGRTLDFDYLVRKSEKDFRVTQGILHKVDGVKRKYDLTK
ncbi:hypothetical protein MJD09_20195 [bacterium]|nr:hypothetical protein [bacterium]